MQTDAALLAVDALDVRVRNGPMLLQGVSLSLGAGDILSIVGESGAGKSLLLDAIMGLLVEPLHAAGHVRIGRHHQSAAGQVEARRSLWGRQVTLIPQEPIQALDPLRSVRAQQADVHSHVQGHPRAAAMALARNALDEMGLPATRLLPGQLSGGMAQRAVTAMALGAQAPIVLADEPTKGLDGESQSRVIAALRAVAARGGCAVVVTHDPELVRSLGGFTMVLREGLVIETGSSSQVLDEPAHAFTQALWQSHPSRWEPLAATGPREGRLLLRAHGLGKHMGSQILFRDIDIELHERQRLVIQGPSGSGKSTLGNALLGLTTCELGRVDRFGALVRAHSAQKLYQDPVTAFPEGVALKSVLNDVARRHRQPWPDVLDSLVALGLNPNLLERCAAQVSGGELQRVAMVRAMLARPALLLADEATSRLDLNTQQRTTRWLIDLCEAHACALVWITHCTHLARKIGQGSVALGGHAMPPD